MWSSLYMGTSRNTDLSSILVQPPIFLRFRVYSIKIKRAWVHVKDLIAAHNLNKSDSSLIETLEMFYLLFCPNSFFFQALETRMEALRKRGRRIILLGDLNIAPQPVDQCEAGEQGFL